MEVHNILKERYFVSLQITQGLNTKIEQYPLLVRKGMTPKIGDLSELIEGVIGIPVEITDFIKMEFRPLHDQQTNIRSVRVTRTTPDSTYATINLDGDMRL